MFAAGYSAKVTKENEQGVFLFENSAERNEFTFNCCKCKVGGGSVEFKYHVFQFQVSGYCMFCPDQALKGSDENQRGKDGK